MNDNKTIIISSIVLLILVGGVGYLARNQLSSSKEPRKDDFVIEQRQSYDFDEFGYIQRTESGVALLTVDIQGPENIPEMQTMYRVKTDVEFTDEYIPLEQISILASVDDMEVQTLSYERMKEYLNDMTLQRQALLDNNEDMYEYTAFVSQERTVYKPVRDDEYVYFLPYTIFLPEPSAGIRMPQLFYVPSFQLGN